MFKDKGQWLACGLAAALATSAIAGLTMTEPSEPPFGASTAAATRSGHDGIGLQRPGLDVSASAGLAEARAGTRPKTVVAAAGPGLEPSRLPRDRQRMVAHSHGDAHCPPRSCPPIGEGAPRMSDWARRQGEADTNGPIPPSARMSHRGAEDQRRHSRDRARDQEPAIEAGGRHE